MASFVRQIAMIASVTLVVFGLIFCATFDWNKWLHSGVQTPAKTESAAGGGNGSSFVGERGQALSAIRGDQDADPDY